MAQPTQPVLAPEDRLPNEDEVRALRGVDDPEFRVSIQDLGLVYGVRVSPADNTVALNLTLTSPGCPLAP